VKSFIHGAAKTFPALTILYVGGDPRLVFYGEDNTEVGRLDVSLYTANELSALLVSKGIQPGVKEEVPVENKQAEKVTAPEEHDSNYRGDL